MHEAGHAVAWSALGVPVAYLTIVADANSDGHCQRSDFTSPSSRRVEFIARDLIGMIAGPVAMHFEMMRVVYDDPPAAIESEAFEALLAESTATASAIYTPVTNEDSDDAHIETILRELPHLAAATWDEVFVIKQRLVAVAGELLDAHGRAVQIVADALAKVKTVDGAFVRRVVADCGGRSFDGVCLADRIFGDGAERRIALDFWKEAASGLAAAAGR